MKRAPRDHRYYLKYLFPWTDQLTLIHHYEAIISDFEEMLLRGTTRLLTTPHDDEWETQKTILFLVCTRLKHLQQRLQELYNLQPWTKIP